MDRSTKMWLWLVGLAGVAVCAIPWVSGIIGLIAGVAMLHSNRRDRQWALLHDRTEPLRPMGEAVAGQLVRISGKVVSDATVRAPVSQGDVVYAAVVGTASIRMGENVVELPARHLGEEVEIEDDTGRAVLRLSKVHVLSRHHHKLDEHNEPRVPAARALYSVPENHKLDLEEMTLRAGDTLWVTGLVESVEEIVTDRASGFRGSGKEQRLTLVGTDAHSLLMTNLEPDELRRVMRASPTFIAMGAVWLVAAVASLGFYGWRMFR